MQNIKAMTIYRVIAVCTLCCFLVTQSAVAAPVSGIAIAPVGETPGFLQVSIPAELATLDDIYEAPVSSDPKLILQIRNAHANYGAQQKIRQLLAYLNKTYDINTIFVEGASERLNPNYLKFFPDMKDNLKLADLLVKKGELTGVEQFVLEMDGKGIRAEGVEDADLYRANYEALKKVFSSETVVHKYVGGIESRLETLSSKIASGDMHRMLSEWKKFEKGHRSFMPYVRSLADASKQFLKLNLESLFSQVAWPQITRLLVIQELEKEMDPARANQEKDQLIKFLQEKRLSKDLIKAIEEFKNQHISVTRKGKGGAAEALQPRYLLERLVKEAGPKGFQFSDYPYFSAHSGYLILRSELDSMALFNEINLLFTEILDELAKTENQKALLTLYRDEELVRKLLNLELTRSDWTEADSKKPELAMDSMVQRLKELGKAVNAEHNLADTAFETKQVNPEFQKNVTGVYEAAYSFYGYAREREDVFYEKMSEVMSEKGENKAVLITGGFHTEGVSELLREHEINYGILTPRLMEKSNQKLYEDAMLQTTPTIFDAASLELASKMMSAVALAEQGVNIGDNVKGLLSSTFNIMRESRNLPAELAYLQEFLPQYYPGYEIQVRKTDAGYEVQFLRDGQLLRRGGKAFTLIFTVVTDTYSIAPRFEAPFEPAEIIVGDIRAIVGPITAAMGPLAPVALSETRAAAPEARSELRIRDMLVGFSSAVLAVPVAVAGATLAAFAGSNLENFGVDAFLGPGILWGLGIGSGLVALSLVNRALLNQVERVLGREINIVATPSQVAKAIGQTNRMAAPNIGPGMTVFSRAGIWLNGFATNLSNIQVAEQRQKTQLESVRAQDAEFARGRSERRGLNRIFAPIVVAATLAMGVVQSFAGDLVVRFTDFQNNVATVSVLNSGTNAVVANLTLQGTTNLAPSAWQDIRILMQNAEIAPGQQFSAPVVTPSDGVTRFFRVTGTEAPRSEVRVTVSLADLGRVEVAAAAARVTRLIRTVVVLGFVMFMAAACEVIVQSSDDGPVGWESFDPDMAPMGYVTFTNLPPAQQQAIEGAWEQNLALAQDGRNPAVLTLLSDPTWRDHVFVSPDAAGRPHGGAGGRAFEQLIAVDQSGLQFGMTGGADSWQIFVETVLHELIHTTHYQQEAIADRSNLEEENVTRVETAHFYGDSFFIYNGDTGTLSPMYTPANYATAPTDLSGNQVVFGVRASGMINAYPGQVPSDIVDEAREISSQARSEVREQIDGIVQRLNMSDLQFPGVARSFQTNSEEIGFDDAVVNLSRSLQVSEFDLASLVGADSYMVGDLSKFRTITLILGGLTVVSAIAATIFALVMSPATLAVGVPVTALVLISTTVLGFKWLDASTDLSTRQSQLKGTQNLISYLKSNYPEQVASARSEMREQLVASLLEGEVPIADYGNDYDAMAKDLFASEMSPEKALELVGSLGTPQAMFLYEAFSTLKARLETLVAALIDDGTVPSSDYGNDFDEMLIDLIESEDLILQGIQEKIRSGEFGISEEPATASEAIELLLTRVIVTGEATMLWGKYFEYLEARRAEQEAEMEAKRLAEAVARAKEEGPVAELELGIIPDGDVADIAWNLFLNEKMDHDAVREMLRTAGTTAAEKVLADSILEAFKMRIADADSVVVTRSEAREKIMTDLRNIGPYLRWNNILASGSDEGEFPGARVTVTDGSLGFVIERGKQVFKVLRTPESLRSAFIVQEFQRSAEEPDKLNLATPVGGVMFGSTAVDDSSGATKNISQGGFAISHIVIGGNENVFQVRNKNTEAGLIIRTNGAYEELAAVAGPADDIARQLSTELQQLHDAGSVELVPSVSATSEGKVEITSPLGRGVIIVTDPVSIEIVAGREELEITHIDSGTGRERTEPPLPFVLDFKIERPMSIEQYFLDEVSRADLGTRLTEAEEVSTSETLTGEGLDTATAPPGDPLTEVRSRSAYLIERLIGFNSNDFTFRDLPPRWIQPRSFTSKIATRTGETPTAIQRVVWALNEVVQLRGEEERIPSYSLGPVQRGQLAQALDDNPWLLNEEMLSDLVFSIQHIAQLPTRGFRQYVRRYLETILDYIYVDFLEGQERVDEQERLFNELADNYSFFERQRTIRNRPNSKSAILAQHQPDAVRFEAEAEARAGEPIDSPNDLVIEQNVYEYEEDGVKHEAFIARFRGNIFYIYRSEEPEVATEPVVSDGYRSLWQLATSMTEEDGNVVIQQRENVGRLPYALNLMLNDVLRGSQKQVVADSESLEARMRELGLVDLDNERLEEIFATESLAELAAIPLEGIETNPQVRAAIKFQTAQIQARSEVREEARVWGLETAVLVLADNRVTTMFDPALEAYIRENLPAQMAVHYGQGQPWDKVVLADAIVAELGRLLTVAFDIDSAMEASGTFLSDGDAIENAYQRALARSEVREVAGSEEVLSRQADALIANMPAGNQYIETKLAELAARGSSDFGYFKSTSDQPSQATASTVAELLAVQGAQAAPVDYVGDILKKGAFGIADPEQNAFQRYSERFAGQTEVSLDEVFEFLMDYADSLRDNTGTPYLSAEQKTLLREQLYPVVLLAFSGISRKRTEVSYIFHLLGVTALSLQNLMETNLVATQALDGRNYQSQWAMDMVVASLYHDLIEDTGITIAQLRERQPQLATRKAIRRIQNLTKTEFDLDDPTADMDGVPEEMRAAIRDRLKKFADQKSIEDNTRRLRLGPKSLAIKYADILFNLSDVFVVAEKSPSPVDLAFRDKILNKVVGPGGYMELLVYHPELPRNAPGFVAMANAFIRRVNAITGENKPLLLDEQAIPRETRVYPTQDVQLDILTRIMQDIEKLTMIAKALHDAYYLDLGETPPAFDATEENIAINLAGFIAALDGVGYLSERSGNTVMEILDNINDGLISEEDGLTLARFANATWAAGQPFRGLERVKKPNFIPPVRLPEGELEKDFTQISKAANLLRDLMRSEVRTPEQAAFESAYPAGARPQFEGFPFGTSLPTWEEVLRDIGRGGLVFEDGVVRPTSGLSAADYMDYVNRERTTMRGLFGSKFPVGSDIGFDGFETVTQDMLWGEVARDIAEGFLVYDFIDGVVRPTRGLSAEDYMAYVVRGRAREDAARRARSEARVMDEATELLVEAARTDQEAAFAVMERIQEIDDLMAQLSGDEAAKESILLLEVERSRLTGNPIPPHVTSSLKALEEEAAQRMFSGLNGEILAAENRIETMKQDRSETMVRLLNMDEDADDRVKLNAERRVKNLGTQIDRLSDNVERLKDLLKDHEEALGRSELRVMTATPEIEAATIGYNPDTVRSLELANIDAELKSWAIVAALAGNIVREGLTVETMTQIFTAIASVSVAKAAAWISQVRSILQSADEQGVVIEAKNVGEGMSPQERLGHLAVLSNPSQYKVLTWMADPFDRAGFAATEAQAKAAVAELAAEATAKDLNIQGRFDIVVVDQFDPMRRLQPFINSVFKAMPAISRQSFAYVLMGAPSLLAPFAEAPIQGIMINEPADANARERIAASIIAAQASQKILLASGAEDIDQRVADMLDPVAKGRYDVKPTALAAMIATAFAAIQAIMTAA